jgi:hypothetical protein
MKDGLFKLVEQRRFAVMIAAAVLVTIILTTVSITVYVASGAVNIDLSRPEYEKVRESVIEPDETEVPFSTTGLIDADAIDDFTNRIEKLRAELGQMNDFGGDVLSDQALNLNENE